MPDVLEVSTRPVAASPYIDPTDSPITMNGRNSANGSPFGGRRDEARDRLACGRRRGHAGGGRAVRQRELLVHDLDREEAALGLVGRVGVGKSGRHATERLVLELLQARQDVGRGGDSS